MENETIGLGLTTKGKVVELLQPSWVCTSKVTLKVPEVSILNEPKLPLSVSPVLINHVLELMLPLPFGTKLESTKLPGENWHKVSEKANCKLGEVPITVTSIVSLFWQLLVLVTSKIYNPEVSTA